MADPMITLDDGQVSVDPGGQATVTVTVTNTGTIVEGFAVEVLGEASAWATVAPAELSVYPQQTESAVITFAPPAGSEVDSGQWAFGVRARSVVDPGSSAVAEGDLDVSALTQLQAEIVPSTSKGRWHGEHTVQFSNWGNGPVRLRIAATDPDQALGFLVRPDLVDVAAGETAKVRIRARTRKPIVRGSPTRLPFQVVGERDSDDAPTGPTQPHADPGRPTVDAALNLLPLLTRPVMIIGGLVLAAAVAGGAYALTRPQPEPTFEELGVPATPELIAAAAGSDTIRLTWTAIDQVEGYKLLTVDPQSSAVAGSQQLAPDLAQTDVGDLKPQSEHCFQLQAVRGNLQSPRSELVCATTAAAEPSPSPSPAASSTPDPTDPAETPGSEESPGSQGEGQSSPSAGGSTGSTPTTSGTPSGTPTITADPLAGGVWIAAAQIWAQAVLPDAPQAVIDRLDQSGIEADSLDSTEYPRMGVVEGVPLEPSIVVYTGPFPTRVEAETACAEINQALEQQLCLPLQPDPPQ